MILIAAAFGCGGGDSGPSSGPSPAPPPTPPPSPGGTTITIANNAVLPRTLTVPVGSRVTFVNNDTRVHDMASDPHPEHTNCPALNDVGFLQPNQSRTSGNLNTTRTCGFHDHNQPSTASLQGSITIQ